MDWFFSSKKKEEKEEKVKNSQSTSRTPSGSQSVNIETDEDEISIPFSVLNGLNSFQQDEYSESDTDYEYLDTIEIEKVLKQSHKTIETCVNKCSIIKNDFNYLVDVDDNQYKIYENKLEKIMNELDSIEIHGNKNLRRKLKQATTNVKELKKILCDLRDNPTKVMKEIDDSQMEIDQAEVKVTSLGDLLKKDGELNYLTDHVLQHNPSVQNKTSDVYKTYFSNIQCTDQINQNLPKTPTQNGSNQMNTGVMKHPSDAAGVTSGPVQLLIRLDNENFEFNDEAVRRVVFHEDVKDRKIVVVSVVGRFRRGKSFLVNFMRRYLTAKGGENWLQSEDTTKLEGFKWRWGEERETSGILMWPEPFLIGNDLALILLDTQGTFDSETSPRENAFIFALSTMLSSIQIYNVVEYMQMDDFTNLQLFLEFGNLIMQECNATAFQKLIFLVRDFKYPTDAVPFGLKGGTSHLSKWMKGGASSATHNVSEMINACFETISCFLLPRPGPKVSDNPDFKGDLEDIDPVFLKYMQIFVENTLCTRNLPPKRNGSDEIRAKDWLAYARMCVTELQKKELEAQTILDQAAGVDHTRCVQAALDYYEREMSNLMPVTENIQHLHQETANNAIQMFNSARKFGGAAVTLRYYEVLIKELTQRFESGVQKFIQDRLSKRQEVGKEKVRSARKYHESKINEFLRSKDLETSFIQKHELFRNEAIKYFVKGVKGFLDGEQEMQCIQKLDKRMNEYFESQLDAYNEFCTAEKAKQQDEECNNSVDKAVSKYCNLMKNGMNESQLDDDISEMHIDAKNQAFVIISAMQGKYKKHDCQKYIKKFISEVEMEFIEFNKNYQETITAKQEAEKKELRSMNDQVKKKYSQLMATCKTNNVMDLKTIKSLHETARKTIQAEIFTPIIKKMSREQYDPYIKEAKMIIKKAYKEYTDEYKMSDVLNTIIKNYKCYMKNFGVGTEYVSDLNGKHNAYKLKIINELKQVCSEPCYQQYEKKIMQQLENEFKEILKKNEQTGTTNQKMQHDKLRQSLWNSYKVSVNNETQAGIYVEDLETKLNIIISDTLAQFDQSWNGTEKDLQAASNALYMEMEKDCQSYIIKNKILKPSPKDELQIAHDEALSIYNSEMNEFFTDHLPETTDLKNYHKQVMRTAMKKYKSFGKRAMITAENEAELEEELATLYEKFEIKCSLKLRDIRIKSEGKQNSKSYAIGIDLGTTYSCASVFRNGEVELILNKLRQHTTPSTVYIDEMEIMVGEEAEHKGFLDPENYISEIKRIIGLPYSDPTVQEMKENWLFTVNSKHGHPVIKTTKNAKKEWKPQEISAEILKELKRRAEIQLKSPVHDAVVTIPAYFTEPQRSATLEACKLAGLNILRVLNEPTAAAITYGVQNKTEESRIILVFDFGGGTCDISILEVKGGNFTVKASKGDNKLGGEDFDDRLMKYVIKELEENHGETFDHDSSRRLRHKCEIAKRRLTDSPEYTITIVNCFENEEDIDFAVKRKVFEETCQDLFERALEPVKSCLEEAKLDKNQIDEIVLAGGSSRMPKIRQMLQEFFDGKQLNCSVNADEAIASGAAIEAALLTGECQSAIRVFDITPFSLGISLVDDSLDFLIPKNSQIPCKSKTKRYTTTFDYQRAIEICVYQGEHKENKDMNTLLGKFTLTNIKKAKKGETSADVTFEIDADGILKVTAMEVSDKSKEANIKSMVIQKNVSLC